MKRLQIQVSDEVYNALDKLACASDKRLFVEQALKFALDSDLIRRLHSWKNDTDKIANKNSVLMHMHSVDNNNDKSQSTMITYDKEFD